MRITIGLFLIAAVWGATLGETALVDAAKNRDKEAVRSLLKQHANVNAAETDGTTALHWAAHQNDLEMVQLLVRAGANAKAANRYGVTPLAEAATRGSAAMIETLLKAGADPNTLATPEGETVLMTASRTGNADAVKALLDHGAYVNEKENYRGQTALMWAAAEGHPAVLKLLIGRGAELKIRSFDRDTTLPKLTAGSPVAPISRGGLTALLFAARQGEIESVRTLLDAGADINQVDSDGNNALVLAILNSHYDLAQFLLDRGADTEVANKDGRTALYAAVELHDPDVSPRPSRKETDKLTSLDIINSLLAHGANANAQLKNASTIEKFAQDHGDKTLAAGATPFMRGARSGDVAVMRVLFKNFAEPKLTNKDGLTALAVAAGVGYADKIRGTEAEALEAVKLCLDLGINVNDPTDKGETALHGAALRGADSIVKLLVENGAKVNAANKQGLTPLDVANGKGGAPGQYRMPHESTAALLHQLGGTPGKEVKEAAKVE
jgi:ankyrin repeat protein